VLFELLVSKVASLKLPANSLVPFYKEYSTGGLFGFLSAGTAAQATGRLEAAIAELKAAAAGASATGAKAKVRHPTNTLLLLVF
jgi:hypothetical protein